MMEMISKHYTKIMGAVAVFLIVVGTIAGGLYATGLMAQFVGQNYWIWALSFLVGSIVSFLLTYVIVVMVFGFMAQVLAINEKLSRIEKLIDAIDDSVS